MKGHLLTISFSFLLFPLRYVEKKESISVKTERIEVTAAADKTASMIYASLNLSDMGLSETAFEIAYKGYQKLAQKNKLSRSEILTICDFSQSSNKRRLYIVDLASNKVLMRTYVAHGRGSGSEFAVKFSNRASSHQSSLGFYVTGNTYYGEHGLSLRLQGMETGFNNLALKRNIVVHGARYIGGDLMGRSYGCPAVPQKAATEIINIIRNGTCLFIYHPTKKYLQNSRILND